MSSVLRRLTAGVAFLLSAAGLTVGLPASSQADQPTVIRIGGQGSGFGKPYGTGIIGVLRAGNHVEDEFKADGIKVEYTFFNGTGPAINEALANGQLDFANYGGLPNIVGRAGGLRTKIVASYGVGEAYVAARRGLPIRSIADLKGRKVAVAKGTINHLSMNRLLERYGLTEKDLQIVHLTASDQLAALSSGDVDAAFGSYNFLALRDQGVVDIVASTREAPAASFFGAFTVTEDFATKYPEITRRVVKAYVKAAHWASLEENRDALLKLWALSGTAPGALAEDIANQPLAYRNNPLIDDFYVEQYRAGIAFALENKLIRKPVDLAQWIDRSHVDAAIRELGLADFWKPRAADGKPKA